MKAPPLDWQTETVIYDRPHPRLVEMARLIRALPDRTILDIGCSTAIMKDLIGDGFEYFGCDIANAVGERLDHEHFRQIDFNKTTDLGAFAGRGIRAIHIGGVLEYLERPEALLQAARDLTGKGGHAVISIINFTADRYRDPASHHAAWIYKPKIAEFLGFLEANGWSVLRTQPFYLERGMKAALRSLRPGRNDVGNATTATQAEQFIVTAKAR
jgi:SAM-dependent methyltransferase